MSKHQLRIMCFGAPEFAAESLCVILAANFNIIEIQAPGKKRMVSKDFLNGIH